MSDIDIQSFLSNMDQTLEPSLSLTLAGLAITVSIFLTASVSSLANTISQIKDRGGDPKDWQISRIDSAKTARL